jgi:N-methylhydantoinase A
MVFAIRAVTVERGLDPREFVVFSYGGGGGLFAAAVAEELEVPEVLVPRAPANFSAWGILTSDYREDVAETKVRPLDDSSVGDTAAGLRRLAEEAAANLERYGFAEGQIDRLYRADIRYAGQDHAITVPLEPAWLDDHPALLAGARERFTTAHVQLYGHGTLDPPLELVTSRARAVGQIARPSVSEPTVSGGSTLQETRQVSFGAHGRLETPVHRRESFTSASGPAIVEEWATTVVVPPGWTGSTDRLGNLLLRRDGR